MALNYKAWASPGLMVGPSGVEQRLSSIGFMGIIVNAPAFIARKGNSILHAMYTILGG